MKSGLFQTRVRVRPKNVLVPPVGGPVSRNHQCPPTVTKKDPSVVDGWSGVYLADLRLVTKRV